jgi:NADH:ubiquinone oxidoreductase subunit 6 (subunit J)
MGAIFIVIIVAIFLLGAGIISNDQMWKGFLAVLTFIGYVILVIIIVIIIWLILYVIGKRSRRTRIRR